MDTRRDLILGPDNLPGLSYGQLEAMGKPQNPGDPEFYWDTLWDQQAYAAAGQLRVNFLQAVPATNFVGNWPQAGALQANEYFIPVYLTLDLLLPVEAAGAAIPGNAFDQNAFFVSGLGVFNYAVQSKPYLSIPLYQIPSAGHIRSALANGATAAPSTLSTASRGIGGEGWPLDGIPIIKPVTKVTAFIQFPALVPLTAGATNVTLGIHGWHFRPIQ